MKLSDVAPTEGIGYREVLEREALAAKARAVAREAASERTEAFRRALAGQTGPDCSWAAERILEILEQNITAYVDPKLLLQPDPRAVPPKKVVRTMSMIGGIRGAIALHALAVTKLVRLIPEAEVPGFTLEFANAAERYHRRMEDDVDAL